MSNTFNAKRLTEEEVAARDKERDAHIDAMSRLEMAAELRRFADQPHWRLYPRLMRRMADELEK